MKRTYRVKMIKTAQIEVTVEDDKIDQDKIFEATKDKIGKGRNVKWSEPRYTLLNVHKYEEEGPDELQIKYIEN